MRILFDTNIILDVFLDRSPFSLISSQLLSKVERQDIEGYLCATTITTIHYLVEKTLGKKVANDAVDKLLNIYEIAPVNKNIIQKAVAQNYEDFEDGVINESGIVVNVDGIVTRDIKGFKKSKLNIYLPKDLLLILNSN
ncbi:MAG: PIN domain-containing protein [Calditrichia bacterium]|nr:PIN domain-containing protein [Calditrichia bacterium]